MARFAAIGLDHRHVYDMTEGLLAAGARMCRIQPRYHRSARVLAGFRKRFPDVPRVPRGSACSMIRPSISSSCRRCRAIAPLWRSRRCGVARMSCRTSRA